MAVQIQLRRGTAAQWTSANPTLAEGEMGVETDTDLFKIGNGSTAWNSLVYGGLEGPQGASGSNLTTVSTQAGTTYSLVKADAGTLVSFTSSSSVTVTVPTEVSQGWASGEGVVLLQNGTGQVSVVGASGVTVNTAALAKSRTQYSTLSLVYLGSNTWILAGDTAVL
jgi:hypothetical protein